MGLDVATFDYILESGFANTWMTTPIPRNDVWSLWRSSPRCKIIGSTRSSGTGAFTTSTPPCSASTLNKYLLLFRQQHRVTSPLPSTILLLTLQLGIPEAKISWLQPHEFQECSDLIIQRHPRLRGAFASIDGLTLLFKHVI